MTERTDHAAEAERVSKLAYDYETAPEHNTSANFQESQAVIGAVSNGYARAQGHATLALAAEVAALRETFGTCPHGYTVCPYCIRNAMEGNRT